MNSPGQRGHRSGTEERMVPVPPVGGLASFSRKKGNASNGTAGQAMRTDVVLAPTHTKTNDA